MKLHHIMREGSTFRLPLASAYQAEPSPGFACHSIFGSPYQEIAAVDVKAHRLCKHNQTSQNLLTTGATWSTKWHHPCASSSVALPFTACHYRLRAWSIMTSARQSPLSPWEPNSYLCSSGEETGPRSPIDLHLNFTNLSNNPGSKYIVFKEPSIRLSMQCLDTPRCMKLWFVLLRPISQA